MSSQDHLLTHENHRIDGQGQAMTTGNPQHTGLKQRVRLKKL
jgi:hypothetical protein